MAKKIKYTEKELKGPDKFTTTVVSGFEYFADHTTKILVIVVSVIVVLVAAYIFNGYMEGRGDKASLMFDKAVEDYEIGNYQQAIDGFSALRKEYGSKSISSVGLYYAGLSNYYLGNYEESVGNLNEFLASGITDRVLTQSAIFNQGLAKFKEGKYQDAIDYLSKVDTEPGEPYTEQAKLLIALSYEKLGKPEQAKTIYNELEQMQSAGLASGMSPVMTTPSSQATGAQ